MQARSMRSCRDQHAPGKSGAAGRFLPGACSRAEMFICLLSGRELDRGEHGRADAAPDSRGSEHEGTKHPRESREESVSSLPARDGRVGVERWFTC